MHTVTENYALNIYLRVFGITEDDGNCNANAVLAAVNTLTERERLVLERRYKHGETLKKTAETIGVGSERVRQIEIKAFRKLRHPSRQRDMNIAVIITARDYLREQLDNAKAVIEEQRRIIAELSLPLPLERRTEMFGAEAAITDNSLKKLEEMDLTVRSYNCLRRAGIQTAGDILRLCETPEDLRKIRNIGRKSADEIIEKMCNFGFEWWSDKMKGEQ